MTYLFLGEAQRQELGDSGVKWENLPTLSSSTRPCYLTMVNCKIIFNSASVHDSLNVKMKIPSSNYFSSDNGYPVMAFLNTADSKTYTLEHDNEIRILTNDNLKSVEFILEDNNGEVIAIDAADSMEVMLQLEYINSMEQTKHEQYNMPMHLG